MAFECFCCILQYTYLSDQTIILVEACQMETVYYPVHRTLYPNKLAERMSFLDNCYFFNWSLYDLAQYNSSVIPWRYCFYTNSHCIKHESLPPTVIRCFPLFVNLTPYMLAWLLYEWQKVWKTTTTRTTTNDFLHKW